MTDWDMDRDRRRREENDDWDWYYYEYRYIPYSYGNREMNERNYGRRPGRDYGRESSQNYGRDYGQGSGRDYEEDYGNPGYWNRGRYSGVGPRGYRRSDDRIREDVNDRLTWHGQIDATEIQADVSDGIVTLSGTVNSRYEKRMAEIIAENVWGVSDIQNNLKIERLTTDWNRGGWQGEGMGDQTREDMQNQVRQGMKVVGRDGTDVGEVKEVRSYDFLVDRPMARDVYIPFNACQKSGGQIRLNVRADEVDDQDWPMPDLMDMDINETTSSKRMR